MFEILECKTKDKIYLDARKSVLGVSDQVSFKPVCPAREHFWNIEILHLAGGVIFLSRKPIIKVLIILHIYISNRVRLKPVCPAGESS